MICSRGTNDSYNTEISEWLHIDFAKASYCASNKHDFMVQMTIWLTQQEAVQRFGSYLEWAIPEYKMEQLEDDDDGDTEDGRGPPPPPPQHSGYDHELHASASHDFDGADAAVGRDSVSLSVTETGSEGDWLTAAIGEDEPEDIVYRLKI